ncbi:MAG TPA: tripartite tricarboxylate transporter substrate binding protein [Xanthobacteraceae bacterium]|nr:tripartite tricarboxylate transporter substrate binding protein [Xanthobacteraceae bacterium]
MTFSQLMAAVITGLVCLWPPARAQESYPSKLITIVAPITAGTTIDILARLYADKLSKRFGQQVVVLNRPGAGGLIAAQAVASSPPDGYTLILVNSGHAILGTLNKNLPFDPVRDFAGVSLVGEAPTIVTVPPTLEVSNLKQFVERAKAKPGTINYGSAGIGTATHLAGAYFALKTGTDLVHIPYTVSATIIADMLGGRIQASFVPAAFVLPLLQDGRLRALAVSAKEPVTEPIKIPTALSQGIDYQNATWYGILAPAQTPKAVLQTLSQAISEVGKDPELQAKIRAQGIDPRDIELERFDAHIQADMARLDPLLKAIADQR